MKTVRVMCVWNSHHEIEVDDDWEGGSCLDDFPEDALEDMSPRNAELVDWEVTR